MENFTCPRRFEPFTYGYGKENLDHWRESGGCSYCGSISSGALFKSIEEEIELTPTDKNYKVYVGGGKKFYFPHFSEEEILKFIELYNDKKIKLGFPGYFYRLPYFMKV